MSATAKEHWTRVDSVANLHDREVRLTVYFRAGEAETFHGTATVSVIRRRFDPDTLFLALDDNGFEFDDGELIGLTSSDEPYTLRGPFDYALWVRDA